MKYTLDQLESLRQFATVKQSEYIDAMIANDLNGHKAADALGINNTTLYRGLNSLLENATKPNKTAYKDSILKHFVIPDVQAKQGIDFSYLKATGNYIVEKKPNVIVCIGDFADMESLSSYDKGMKSFEGRSYNNDLWAAREAMDALLTPIYNYNKIASVKYEPRMVLTLGNHENRINRVINEDRKLDGLIAVGDLPYQDWEVHDFLEVVSIDGIAYSHYFTSGVMGRPITSSNAILNKKHMSCFAGHQQGRQISYGRRADGREMTAIISGSFYEHNEDYLGAQGNQHWRGCYMLNDVEDGAFDEMALSIKYLKANYL